MRATLLMLLLGAGGLAGAQEKPPEGSEDAQSERAPVVVDVISGEELQEIAIDPEAGKKFLPKPKETISLDEAVDMPRDI